MVIFFPLKNSFSTLGLKKNQTEKLSQNLFFFFDEETLYLVRIARQEPVGRFPDGPEPTYGDL